MINVPVKRSVELISHNKSIIISGLPGIGKTTYALNVATKSLYANIYIDCEVDFDEIQFLLVNSTSEECFSTYIERHFGLSKYEQEDLIFVFDNIDKCDALINEIYPLIKDYNYKYIFIYTVHNDILDPLIINHPYQIQLEPICFDEYLQYENASLASDMLRYFNEDLESFPSQIHDGIYKSFVDFYYTGGFPMPRNTYFSYDFGDVLLTSSVKMNHNYVIETIFKRSFLNDKTIFKCRQIIDSIVKQMANGNYGRYVLSTIRDGASLSEFNEAFDFLIKNGLISRLYNTDKNFYYICYLYDVAVTRELINEYCCQHNMIPNKKETERIAMITYLVSVCKRFDYNVSYWRSRYGTQIDVIIDKKGTNIAVKADYTEGRRSRALEEYGKKHPNDVLYELNGYNLKKEFNKINVPYYAIYSMLEN